MPSKRGAAPVAIITAFASNCFSPAYKALDSWLKETLSINAFSTLALYYEYIWYGNMQISKEDFNKVESTFNQFLNGL